MDIREFTHIGLSNDGTVYFGLLEDGTWEIMTGAEIAHYSSTIEGLQPGETRAVSAGMGMLGWALLALVAILIFTSRGK